MFIYILFILIHICFEIVQVKYVNLFGCYLLLRVVCTFSSFLLCFHFKRYFLQRAHCPRVITLHGSAPFLNNYSAESAAVMKTECFTQHIDTVEN